MQESSFASALPEEVSLVPERFYVRLDAPDATTLRVEPQDRLDPAWTYEWSTTRGELDPSYSWADLRASAADDEPGYASVSVVIRKDSAIVASRCVTLLFFKQFILLKADDLDRLSVVSPGPTNWQYYFDFVTQERRVKSSAGVITQNLDPIYFSGLLHTEFVSFCRDLQDSGYVELFHHGLDHSASPPDWYEFKNTSYAWQRSHLDLGRFLGEAYLSVPFACFGAPYNSIDATTTQIMNETPSLKVWYFGPASGANATTLERYGAEAEPSPGVPNFDFFLHSDADHPLYSGYTANPVYTVIQIHPGFQTFRDQFDEFRQMVDYLLSHQMTFVTPSEYSSLVTDGLPPACPASQAPLVLTQPVSRTVNPGAEVVFSVEASGTAPLTYQWKKGTLAIPGATDATCRLAAAQEDDEGSYLCVVGNPASTVRSGAAALSVNDPPVIEDVAVSPSPQLQPGDLVTFHVVLSRGTPPCTYQWKKNGAALGDGVRITGSNSAVLLITSLQDDDEGDYTCVVANAVGSVESPETGLIVGEILEFTHEPEAQRKYEGEEARYEVRTIGGRGEFHYQWLFDDGKGGGPIPVGEDGPLCVVDPVSAADAGMYCCEITDLRGTYRSNSASLAVAPVLAITAQPRGATLFPTDVFELDAGLSGGFPPLHYTWRKDAPPIDVGTEETYTLRMPRPEDAGGYYLIVTDDNGAVVQSDTVWIAIATGVPLAGIFYVAMLALSLSVVGVWFAGRRRAVKSSERHRKGWPGGNSAA